MTERHGAHGPLESRESAYADEFVDVPHGRQCVVASGRKVVSARIERDAYAVGRVSVENVLRFHVWVAKKVR